MKNLFKTVALIYCVVLSPKILAVDGVLEINHTCATQLGCFSGDSAGYPVVINNSAAKSYRLTSDLILPDVDTTGITIASSDITLDLNGFSIVSAACFNTTTDCTALSGNGDGISMSLTAVKGVTIKNGSIIGMGRRGLSIIGTHARLENLQVRWNRELGINANQDSIIVNNIVSNNGGNGINAGNNSIVKENIVSFSEFSGISCGQNCIIRENESHNNALGIFADRASIIDKNNAHNNSNDGISTRNGASVTNNNAFQNGDDGINVSEFDGSIVHNNMVHSNTGFGIRFSSGNNNPYSQNTIINNTGGTVNLGFDMGDNFCETNKVCP